MGTKVCGNETSCMHCELLANAMQVAERQRLRFVAASLRHRYFHSHHVEL